MRSQLGSIVSKSVSSVFTFHIRRFESVGLFNGNWELFDESR